MKHISRLGLLALGAVLAIAPLSMAAPEAAPGDQPAADSRKTGKQGGRQGGRKGGRQGGNPAQRLERLGQFLELTDAQKAKIKPILEESRKDMEALRADTTLNGQQKRLKLRELRQESEKKVDAVLTPEQRKKLEEMKAKMKERMKNGKSGEGRRGRGGKAGKRGGAAPAAQA